MPFDPAVAAPYPFVVMDIGDVLIRTVNTAQYRALERMTGLSWRTIMQLAHESGVECAFEDGSMSPTQLIKWLRKTLCMPTLRDAEVVTAWNTVIGAVDTTVARGAARWAKVGRLLLASNTNPWHWPVVRNRLAAVGITAPAVLSFSVGYTKPDARFFAALVKTDCRAGQGAVYIDDRIDNVEIANQLGWKGWLHSDSVSTEEYLCDLLCP